MAVEPTEIFTGQVPLPRRVLGMLIRPQAEWEVIATERSSVRDLSRRVILPLAAIPAVSVAFGLLLAAGDQADRYRGFAFQMGATAYVELVLVTYAVALAFCLLQSWFGREAEYTRTLALDGPCFPEARAALCS